MYSIMKNDVIIASNIPTFDDACRMARSLGAAWVLSPSGGIAKEYTDRDIEIFLLEQTILFNIDIQYHRLYLSDISETRGWTCYQVFSDYTKLPFNKLYNNATDAVIAFMDLKEKIIR